MPPWARTPSTRYRLSSTVPTSGSASLVSTAIEATVGPPPGGAIGGIRAAVSSRRLTLLALPQRGALRTYRRTAVTGSSRALFGGGPGGTVPRTGSRDRPHDQCPAGRHARAGRTACTRACPWDMSYSDGRTREPGGTGLRGGLAAPDRRT